MIPALAFGAYFAGGNYKNLGGGGGTINTLGGSLKIGANVINGTPNSILYIDSAGKLTEDSNFTRDPSTYATGIIMPQNSGVDEAGLGIRTDILGTPGTDGIAMRRGDIAGTVGDAILAIIDGTPLGAPSRFVIFGNATDTASGDISQFVMLPTFGSISATNTTNETGSVTLQADSASLFSDNSNGGGNDLVGFQADLNGGAGAQFLRGRYQDGTNNYGFQLNVAGMRFDFDNFSGTNGTYYIFPTSAGNNGEFLKTDGTNQLSWSAIPPASATLTDTYIGFGSNINELTGDSQLTYNSTYSFIKHTVPANSDSLTYGAASFSGSGLDDFTLTWDSSIYFSNKYGGTLTITIDGTGTPDTFSWSFTGSYSQIIGSGSNIPITGLQQQLQDNFGGNVIAQVQFTATTGHTLSDQWTASTSLGGNQKGYNLADTYGHEQFEVEPNGGTYSLGDDGTNGGSSWWGNGTQLLIDDGNGELGLFAPRYLRVEPPGGNTMVLADMQNGIWSQYGDFRILDSATSSVWFRSDTANRITFIGDTQGAGNDTLFYVDDVSQTISSTINGTVLIQNVGGSDFFNLNTTTGTVSWGDIGGSGNSLRYTLDDVNKTITENSQDGFWYAGDVDGLFNGTVIALNDSNGRIGLTATLTQIGGAYSIGLQTEAPTTGATVNISSDKSVLILNPAGTLASLTVAMPASPVVGQIVYVATKQTITSISFTATAGVNGAPSTLAANTDTVGFVYISGSLGWQAISH